MLHSSRSSTTFDSCHMFLFILFILSPLSRPSLFVRRMSEASIFSDLVLHLSQGFPQSQTEASQGI